ncbi:MAG: NUDIX hydrolase [bacterium]|nr:NUDIX hydrolase [bacterium]
MDENKIWAVTIKGLVFNEEGKLLLLQEPDGMWELPGGRVEHGEEFAQTLTREIMEEMGVECEIIDQQPHWAWPEHLVNLQRWRVVLGFRINLKSFEFIKSDECAGSAYFDKQGLIDLGDKLWAKGIIRFL